MAKKHHRPPPPPSPPSPAPKPAEDVLDSAIRLAGVAVLAVGVITLASPWLRGAERPLARGVVCWDTTRTTFDRVEHRHFCEPARGWHYERLPGELYPVPDRVRRYPVRD